MDEEDYEKWQIQFLNECYRTLKPNGSLFYNHKIRRFEGEAIFPKWIFDTDFKMYQMIIWDRGGNQDPNKSYLFPNTELIFWLVKDKPKVFKDNAIYKNEVWRINPSRLKIHPATFPEEIPLNCILLTTSENDTVLDPFMGSGTTGIVSKKTNRNFIGIEIDETYFNLSKQKIEITTNSLNDNSAERVEDYFKININENYKRNDFIS